MNPELVRNAWLELRPAWLVGIPVSLALIVLIGLLQLKVLSLEAVGGTLSAYGLFLFMAFALLGAFKASQSVTREMADGTWEMQRLSQHRPGELLVGKLLGSTILGWYGGAMALGLFLLGRSLTTPAALMVLDVVTLVLAALWLHAAALFGSFVKAGALRAMRRPTHGHGGMAITVVAMFFVVGPLFAGGHAFFFEENAFEVVAWWLPIPLRLFVPLTCAMFLAWTLAGTHRAIRAELQEPVGPWTLLGFLAFFALYVHPMVAAPLGALLGNPFVAFAATFAAVFGAALPALIIGERFDVVRLRTLVAAAHRRDRGAVVSQLPLWAFTGVAWALAVVALGLASLATFSQEGVLAFLFAVGVGLILVRDLGIMLAIQLAPRGSRDPAHVAVAWIVVLYALLPMLAVSAPSALGVLLFVLFPFLAVLPGLEFSAVATALGLALALPASLAPWLVVRPRARAALGVGAEAPVPSAARSAVARRVPVDAHEHG